MLPAAAGEEIDPVMAHVLDELDAAIARANQVCDRIEGSLPMHCHRPPCGPERHRTLAAGPREEWDWETMPLHDGRRPVGADGLELADCRTCYETSGQRHTISRRVMCLGCGVFVDGEDFCSLACAADPAGE